jgi:hypothetical protein
MPDLPISGLPSASPLTDADLFAVVQGGVTDRATLAQVRDGVFDDAVAALATVAYDSRFSWLFVDADTNITSDVFADVPLFGGGIYIARYATSIWLRSYVQWIQLSTLTARSSYEWWVTIQGASSFGVDPVQYTTPQGQGFPYYGLSAFESYFPLVSAGTYIVKFKVRKLDPAFADIYVAGTLSRVFLAEYPVLLRSSVLVAGVIAFIDTESGLDLATESFDLLTTE